MSAIMNGIEQQSLFADTSLTMNVIVGQDNRYRTGKLVGIGKKIRKKLTRKLEECSEEINRIFTKIRLYTRGKKEDAIALKKKLSEEMQRQVSRLQRLVEKNVDGLSGTASEQYRQACVLIKNDPFIVLRHPIPRLPVIDSHARGFFHEENH